MDTPNVLADHHVTTGDDRVDGPALMRAVDHALVDHNIVAVDLSGLSTLTPTLVHEALLPIADRIGHDVFKQRVRLTGVTRAEAAMIKRSFAIAARNASIA